ncbi:YdcF family protein [Peribacillus loiseleuriae]|uniref:Cytoplasmic protein n=1 Tax=Peribacillus loiseleuriae TaxID=1679170 RepID=A0A0K9GR76_9BACI|nr:YdcF family protein [Peribacillus loiseleuriae]KMY49160.1 cytoplasmic protein [Peribacillus loiseleuriae]
MGKINNIMLIAAILGVVYIGFLHVNIQQAIQKKAPIHADYLIVLGAQVRGTVPSLSLQYRINTAAEYLTSNKSTVAIVSGGQGNGEEISEAEAMKRGLLKNGIEESRIIMEDRSTSTYENIKYSKQLIPEGAKKGFLVTNDFHVYRAEKIAASQGLKLQGIAADTPKVVLVKSYIREYLAITKFYGTELLRRIKLIDG